MPLVFLVDEGDGRHLLCRPVHLVKLAVERRAVVGILGATHGPHHEAFLVGHRQAGLRAGFVGLVHLPLRNAFNLGCMQAVDLAPVRASS